VIELKDVSKVFSGKTSFTALANINLTIEKGDMVSIVGPSGSGKSTLLNLVGTLDHPSTGEIHIEGQLLSRLTDDERTRMRGDKIGFVFQFFHLLPTLGALQNVCVPLHLRGWPRKKAEARARELLRLVQFDGKEERLPDELSGGERQRVAIARALASYPPILLADEPTGNLDTQSGKEIVRLISDLHKKLGATVLIVTHNEEVAQRCSRTIVLRDGRIVGDQRR
jgi:ABC-type lipoprotein export system ATPase subunit